jgi:hypothetical protein
MKTLCILLTLCSMCAMAQDRPVPDDDRRGAFTIGAAMGTPSGLAFAAGAALDPFQIRIAGGWWKSGWNGIQGSIGIPFSRGPYLTHGLAIAWGFYKANPVLPDDQGNDAMVVKQEHYVGLVYDVDYAGFFLQSGLAAGWGDYPNPQVLVQFGYLFSL